MKSFLDKPRWGITLQTMKNVLLVCVLASVFMAQFSFGAPLHQAVRARDLATVREILEISIGTALDATISGGVAPLHLAAATDQPEMVRLLLERGASVNSRTTLGFTPLHWAASRDALDSMMVLLESGAELDARARNDITPLHWAAARDAALGVQWLLDNGADSEAITQSGDTPLHLAVRQGTYSQTAILLAQFRLAIADKDTDTAALPALPTVAPAVPEASEPDVAVRPGMFLQVAIGLGENLSFVWLEELGLWFGKYEVTNGQYRRYMPAHSSRQVEGFSLDTDNQPVVYVSWEDVRRYCEWLTKHFENRIPEGYVFRMPTEAEWMFAASTGENRTYPWGDEWPPLYGNFSDETARQALSHWRGIAGYDDGYAVTAPVANTGMNELGIFGMAGNVWEWTLNWRDPEQKRFKIRKGGSWDFDTQDSLRIVARGLDRPDARDETIGIRLVVAPALP